MNARIMRASPTTLLSALVWIFLIGVFVFSVQHQASAQASDYGFFPGFQGGGTDCHPETTGTGTLCSTVEGACDSIGQFYGSPYTYIVQVGPPRPSTIGTYLTGQACAYYYHAPALLEIDEILPPSTVGDINSGPGYSNPGPGAMQVSKQIGGASDCPTCPTKPSNPANDDDNTQSTGANNSADGSQSVGNTGNSNAGEPMNVPTGNMAYRTTDYTTTGQNPLALNRYYNSRGAFLGTIGTNWRTSYDRYIRIFPGFSTVEAERADGQILTFTLTGSVYTTDTDVDYKLTNSGSTWTLTDPDDTVETYVNATSGYASGYLANLTTITARNGFVKSLLYNTTGLLSTVTDSYSRTLTFAYDSNNNLHTVTTPDSTVITYGLTAGGSSWNLTSVTFPTTPAQIITYVYENTSLLNALTGIVDEDGNRHATWGYDAYARATSSQTGTGSTANLTTISYNDTDGSRVVTNPLGVQDTYSYTTLQGAQKVSGISRAATATTAVATRAFTYDANGYLLTATDWNGNMTTYTNNAHGLPTKIVEPTRTTNISYDSTFVHLPHQITTTGLKTVFAYDTSGNVHTRTDTDTTTQSIPYSTNGQTRIWTYTYSNFLLTSVQNPRTDVTAITHYGYGTDGALTSITDALTHATNITAHTGGGRPLTIVDPNSVTTTLTYDARQRLTTSAVTTTGGALTTTYTIDPTGELKQLTLPDSSLLAYTYDDAHRLTQVTDTQNNYSQFTPNALGEITAINTFNSTSGLRYQHSATFDALGRILTDVGGATQTTTYSNYDNNGNVQTIKDPLLNQTTQVFDALNRLTQITDANTGITKFTYNTHDRITKVTDANVHATTDVLDGFGDVIQRTSPDTGVTVLHYDGDGNLTQKVDALAVTTNQTFDKLDRILTRSFPADSSQFIGYIYDQTGGTFGFGVGRLTTMTDPMGAHNLQYDERGNIVAHRRFTNPGGLSLGHLFFSYDQAGRLSNTTYPSGLTVYNNRDSIGNIYKVTLTAPGSSTQQTIAFAAYKPFGPLYNLTFGNNESEVLQFDLDYRMQEATDTNTSSINLMDLNYTYDAANNLKTVTDTVTTANNQTLGYDVLNRLNTASGNYGSYIWTLDKVGNLKTIKIGTVTTTYTLNTGTNQLATIKVGTAAATPVSTNANGNITSIPPAIGGTAATFTYNVANRLSSVTGTSPAITAIVYDGFGERYSKQDSGSSASTYAYDNASNLLEETIGGAVTDYVYLNGMPLAVFVPGGTSGTVYYVHTDRQGTPQLVTNSAQAAVWSTSYQPYGTTPTIVSSIVQNLRFPGQHFDMETGFNYNNARDYMPNLGRYLEADPIGIRGGLNPYRYANANPGRFTDRRALQVEAGGSLIVPEAELTDMETAPYPTPEVESEPIREVEESSNVNSQNAEALSNGLGLLNQETQAAVDSIANQPLQQNSGLPVPVPGNACSSKYQNGYYSTADYYEENIR